MKSSVFLYPYEKVFRRTQGALSRLGMRIISSDALKGKITAQRSFSLTEPSVTVDLLIEQLEQQNTRVIVQNVLIKKQFFHRNKAIDKKEEEILQAIAAII
jgi:hypothetical protein